MTRLVLHVGHPKTGSTALQHTLSRHADVLLRSSILYPTRAKPRSHKHSLAKPFLVDRDNRALRLTTGLKGNALRRLSRDYWLSLVAEVHEANPENLVLSGECFWRVPEKKQNDFREKLSAVCDTVTVCGYLRSPAARFLSKMNQNVRMFRGISLLKPDNYRAAIEAYESGRCEELSWNVFSRPRFLDGDIVADFCSKYLPGKIDTHQWSRDERSNRSVSNEALAVLDDIPRCFRTGSPDVRDGRRAKAIVLVREADEKIGGRCRPSLKPDIEAALVTRSRDLQWLSDHCGIRFDDVDYSLVGRDCRLDLASLARVEDFCPIDEERMAALRSLAGPEIARLYRRRSPGSALARRILRRTVQRADDALCRPG